MFIKATIKDLKAKKCLEIRNYVLKLNLYLNFVIQQKLLISCEKILM